MKAEIHPELFECRVSCSGCGAEFSTFTTRSEIRVEVCSQCHPFFTGKQARIVDTEGRVEKFIRKFEGKAARVSKRKRKQAAAATERAALAERAARLAAEKEEEERARREEARRKRAEERAARKAAQEREEEAAKAPEAGVASAAPEPEVAPVAAEAPPDPSPAPQAAEEGAGGLHPVIYEKLKQTAKSGKTIGYHDIAPGGMKQPELWKILGEICRHEHKAGRPLLSVIVVTAKSGMPGDGFWELARELGLMQEEEDKNSFFDKELKKVHEQWR